jgi:hypothetical protein
MGTGYSFNLAVCTSPFSWSSRDLNSSLGYLTMHLLISPHGHLIMRATGKKSLMAMGIPGFTTPLLWAQGPGLMAIPAKKAAVAGVL